MVMKSSEAREALRLKPGDKILVLVRAGKVLMLEKPKSYHAAIRRLARRVYTKAHVRKGYSAFEIGSLERFPVPSR